ncbi:restriction endonuclease subunit S [Gammaproteobacteria bacterium]|nr:restriction endonuclease subunit S [Gammaproteobacteria bacterium]
MEALLEKGIDGLKIDRSNWQLVKFGDVAIQQKQTVDREDTDLTRYVKGEHMYSEDIHLREWGELTDEYLGPAFIRKFEEGDILYGSRRTYLRKVVIAPFRGITSNTTFVMKANEEVIDKRLLPYVMLSEGFAQNSIRNSKGSVNPYVNWKDLAGYEFLLPSISEQRVLVDLLELLNSSLENDLGVKKSLEKYLEVTVEDKIHGISLKGKSVKAALKELEDIKDIKVLSELGTIFKGRGIPKADVLTDGLPCVRYGELYTKHHRVIRDFHSFISSHSARQSLLMEKGDVLFAGSGETISEIGKSASFIGDQEAYIGSDILVFRPHKMDAAYAGYLMNSALVRYQLNMFGTGATVMHIYASDIAKIKVPVLSNDEQFALSKIAEEITKNISLLERKITQKKCLLKSVINQVF